MDRGALPANNTSAGLAADTSITGNAVNEGERQQTAGVITITYNDKVEAGANGHADTRHGLTRLRPVDVHKRTMNPAWLPASCR